MCIFCQIINSKAPSYNVYEDIYTIAFLDINPNTDGHVLLLPKYHTQYIENLPPKVIDALFKTMIKIVPPIQLAMNVTDSNITINNGPNAGQIIPHVHIHIIPRPTKLVGLSLKRHKPHITEYYIEIMEKIKKEITASR
jgi:histidine triad (HIT) family protein